MNLNAKLSKRQEQIAALLAAGYAKKEVAGYLCISQRTVENTARCIYEKAEVRSIGQLSSWWFCKTFHISQDSLPTISLQKILAAFCLTLVVLNEALNDATFIRPSRAAAVKVKAANKKSKDDSDTDTLIDA